MVYWLGGCELCWCEECKTAELRRWGLAWKNVEFVGEGIDWGVACPFRPIAATDAALDVAKEVADIVALLVEDMWLPANRRIEDEEDELTCCWDGVPGLWLEFINEPLALIFAMALSNCVRKLTTFWQAS